MKDLNSARWNTICLCAMGSISPDAVQPPFDEEELQLVENAKKQIADIERERGGKPFTFGISADVDFDNPLYDSIYSADFNESLKERKQKKVKKTHPTFLSFLRKHNVHHGPDGKFTHCDGSCRSGKGSVATKAQEAALKKIGDKIRNRKTERLVVVDKDGNEVFAKNGGKTSVTYNISDALLYFDGNIVIHNHPGEFGGTFSGSDLGMFAVGAKEIRAVANEGTYILSLLEGADPGGFSAAFASDRKSFMGMYDILESPKYKDQYDALTKEYRAAEAKHNDAFYHFSKAGDYSSAMSEAKARDKAYNKYIDTIKDLVYYDYVSQSEVWFSKNADKYGMYYEFIPSK